MLELLIITSVVGYIVYLRYYADQKNSAEKQMEQLHEGIELYKKDQFAASLSYFNKALKEQPNLSVAYLYRGRIYCALDDKEAALKSLEEGKSYDNTIADIHLEIGQIRYDYGDYQTAFQDFDQAVFHGSSAEAYHWRGVARQQINQPDEAALDFAKADAVLKAQTERGRQKPVVETAFVNLTLLINGAFTIANALLLLFFIKQVSGIHGPFLQAAFSAGAIGFAEPRKGWILAILQSVILLVGYYVVVGPAESSVDREMETFGIYGAVALTFIGSFMGGYLKRVQKRV
ncbi:tetratricopeptide repeat protein [Fibrella aquatica]|uniref:tetratricopeptide repeat protein n=1 Tax=Fibrella aquatica TaxID=3242487 RepID=UPI00352244EB